MSFRVTQGTLARGVLEGLQTNLTRLQRTQEQLSSGRRLNRPSDSPVDTVNAMQLRADKQRTQQYSRNIDDGLGWLNTADSALTQTTTYIGRVRQLVVAGANGTNGTEERAAMADEVDQLRQGLIQIGNTQYAGRPIFAGTVTGAVAFDSNGAYVGNDKQVNRQVSADPTSGSIAVNVTGDKAFSDLLKGSDSVSPGILERVSTALRSGDVAGLNTALGDLDVASETMRSVQSTVGAKVNRLTSVQTLGDAHLDNITTGLANAESIDLPKTIIDLQIQQNAYQAALGATAKIIQPSLMDFLR